MKKTLWLEHVSGTASHHLPMSMSREIGRIIVHWAYLEHIVQEMNWGALGISQSAGRLAVREPTLVDRFEMLRELINLRKGTWDDDLYKSILSQTRLTKSKRDLVAHGKWAKRNDGWYVELSRGSWPKTLAQLIKGSKKVTPHLVPMDVDKLREATSEIAGLIADVTRLRSSAVGPPQPSPQTHP